MIAWIKNNRDSIIRNSFLIPILLVVIMSISHVVSWYDIGNPLMWAIYLSIAIEIFALASVAASSIKMSRGSIWFLFGLVTVIQIIGNIFYGFKDINPLGEDFLAWMQLIEPVFVGWDSLDHRRFLAAIQGGTLPMMSLTALHFYIKYGDLKSGDSLDDNNDTEDDTPDLPIEPLNTEIIPVEDDVIIIEDIEEVKHNQADEINAKAEAELNKIGIETEENASQVEPNPSFHFEENKPKVEPKPGSHFEQPRRLDKEIDPNTGKYKIM